MDRRQFITGIGAAGVAGMTTAGRRDRRRKWRKQRRQQPPTTTTTSPATTTTTTTTAPATTTTQPASLELKLGAGPHRFWQLEQDHHTGGPFPPGAADGPVSFVRLPADGWQGGQVAVFAMHGNGSTYRHNGTGVDSSLSPGVWVLGPDSARPDANRYAGLAQVLEVDGRLVGFVHQESHDDVATIGVTESVDTGYNWSQPLTKVAGQNLQPDGFRGASLPAVVRNGSEFVMLYENRFGNGRHAELWLATASDPFGDWDVAGAAFPTAGDPHYYGDSPRLFWCTGLDAWVATYGTDLAWRYRTSSDLATWSDPVTVFEWPQRWQDPAGVRRWYQSPIDDSRDDSTVFGTGGLLLEHSIDLADTQQRWPTWSQLGVA